MKQPRLMSKLEVINKPIVFVDVETTGLSAQEGHILDIGVVRIENGVIVATYNQLLHPGVDIPWFITKLTGISDKDVKSSPQFAAVADRLDELFSGAVFAAHNVAFDYSFFTREYKRIGHTLQMDRFCTAKLSRTLHPEHRRHNLDSIIERGRYSIVNRHRAYDDAYVLFQFYTDSLKLHGPKVHDTINKIMIAGRGNQGKKPITYVPFYE